MSLLASAPFQAYSALRSGAFAGLISRPTGPVFVSLRLTQRASRSPLALVASRSDLRVQRYPRLLGQRYFSQLSHLRRRWMERQQQPRNVAQTHQQPQHLQTIPNLQPQTWIPPTTWERANIATYGLIGLFVVIWSAHNYAEAGSVLPSGIPLPRPPGWDRIAELLGFEKSRPKPPRRLQTPSATILEIKTNFSSAALSYRTSDYPPALNLNTLYPFYASIFSPLRTPPPRHQ